MASALPAHDSPTPGGTAGVGLAAAPDNPAEASGADGDRVGRIEARGIDHIPDSERHGRPRELFWVWVASNTTYLYIVFGGTLTLLGLAAWQAMAVVVAGNLLWALVGLLAVTGPASGTPSEVVTRAMYGVRGNRVNMAVLGWGISVAYEAVNLSVGALAGFALVDELGLHVGTFLKLAIVLGSAVVTLAISVYGHATIVALSGWFTGLLVACCALLAVFVVRHAHPGAVPQAAPHGGALWAAALIGFTIIASGPLSWGTSADYARYLPRTASPRAVAGWTALGGFLPAVMLGGLGVLAGTAVDMTDPQTSLKSIVPGWFYPIFLLVVVIGSITNNVLTAYSSGLALQAVGIAWRRSLTVFFDGAVGVALTVYALFVSNFLGTLNNILALSVAFLGPSLTIYGTDVLLRRNRYDGHQLHDETPTSPYWYWRGVNLAGAAAQVLGTGAALLCVNTSLFSGPVAKALADADLSGIVGPVVAATVYGVGMVVSGLHGARITQEQ